MVDHLPGNVSPVLARRIRLAIGIVGLWLVFAGGNLIARAQTAESAQAPPAIIDPSKMRLTFDEPFKRLSISAWGPGTRWIAHTPFAQDFGSARFDDPDYGGPFALTPQGLEITAKQDAKGHWHSGLICSVDHGAETGFAQKYGYFEMKAKLPDAPGVWPGFWLVGTDRSQGSAEFDILESYGSRFPGYLTTLHFWAKPPKRYGTNHFVKLPPGMLASQFNTFGALITPLVVAMYFNRHLVWSVPMLPQFNTPMYILADLALGGGWPIKQLSSPQVMDIQYIRVYQIK
jgi:hypothetical protein